MTDKERADYRAQGALDSFLRSMGEKLEQEGRSKDYRLQFWTSLRFEMKERGS